MPLLTVNDLAVYFPIVKGVLSRPAGWVKAVDGVNITLESNEVLGLVGESGCGKSTTGRCIIKLLKPTRGNISYNGRNVHDLKGAELKDFRKEVQIVFQDPMSSLNPRMTVGSIVAEPLQIHKVGSSRDCMKRVSGLLDLVGLPSNAINRYPHEFSGGQCQRIGIARALALNPKIIIADEPVSALDVSVRAQIINLMMDLKQEFGLSYLFISHDLSVVKHISNRIAVMYLGRVVEIGPSEEVCLNPLHPYSKALLNAVPEPVYKTDQPPRMVLTGDVPSPSNPPSGCHFHTRCPIAKDSCKINIPDLLEKSSDRYVRCPFS